MSNSKINSLLLPLLISILLTILANLKIGPQINSVISTALSPISLPVSLGKSLVSGNVEFIKNLPQLNSENLDLKKQNSSLLSENQNLKDAITDQSTLKKASSFYTEIVPIRIVSIGKTIVATTSQNTDTIKSKQPVVSGSVLLGFVESVSSPVIHITPLDSESVSRFGIHTQQGQAGLYAFNTRTPQIVDLPSENQIILNDPVFTLPSEKLPGNLLIGKITKILTTPQEPLQKAEIKLESGFSLSLTDLVIITKP